MDLGRNDGRTGVTEDARRTVTTPRPTKKSQKTARKCSFLGGHKGWSMEPRSEPEPVWEKREILEESEQKESETVSEWTEILEERERRGLLSWWKMHNIFPKERVISLMPPESALRTRPEERAISQVKSCSTHQVSSTPFQPCTSCASCSHSP
jgi:hypothetical protein